MKKVPPQSAVQERFVGFSFGFRPIGPRARPRRLHTTTRRTKQHRTTHTAHLEKHIHVITDFGPSFIDAMCLHILAFYLICSPFLTSGVILPIFLCTSCRDPNTLFRADKGMSLVTCDICFFISFNSCWLSKKNTQTHIHFLNLFSE